MSTTQNLAAERRTTTGKGVAHKLRKNGRVPAVCYGYKVDAAIPITVEPKELLKALHTPLGRNVVFSMALNDGQRYDVIVKDVQQDHITHELLHVDFISIDLTKPVTVRVPLQVVGKAPGVALEGGLLESLRYDIEVACLPNQIPLHIDVDINDLHLNRTIHVSDLKMPTGATAVTPGTQGIVSCISPQAEVEAAPAAPAEGEAGAVPAEGEAAAAGAPGAPGAAPGAAPAKGAPGAAPAKGAPGAAPAKGAPGAAPARGAPGKEDKKGGKDK